MSFDIEKTCRVCLKTGIELSLLFDDKLAVNGVFLSTMISEITIFKVHRHDEFPQLICHDCVDKVQNAYELKKQFEASHRKLMKYLESINIIVPVENKINLSEKCVQTEESTLYPCEQCDQLFLNPERLKTHRQEAHKGNTCRICFRSFHRFGGLKGHIAICHPEINQHITPNECLICNKQFTRKDHVQRHLRNVHKIDLSILSKEDILAEKMLFEAEAKKKAESLSEIPTVKEPVTAIETKVEPDTSFINLSEKIVDMTTSSPKIETKSAHECHICGKLFSRKDHVGRHIKNVHKINQDSNFGNLLSKIVTDEEGYVEAEIEYNNLEQPEVMLNFDDREDESCGSNGEFLVNNQLIENEDETQLTNFSKNSNADGMEHIEIEHVIVKQEKEEFTPVVNSFVPFSTAKPAAVTPKEKERKYECIECYKSFSNNSHLKRHILSHTKEKPFPCAHCDKRFSRADHLKKHSRNHTLPFKCSICNKSFSNQELLQTHTEKYHSGNEEFCEICNKSFTCKGSLQKHMLLHTEKKWKCQQCSTEFTSYATLKEHTKTHIKDKPFLCSECGQTFARQDYLIIHMRRHNGERPFRCKYCQKGFPRTTDLKAHENCHTGEKKHFCSVCGKGFMKPYKLIVHMRVHTGERPYQCVHCPRAFAQRNDLTAHIRRHTGERFKCEMCGVGFVQNYNLTRHKFDVHGIEIDTRLGRVFKVPPNDLIPEVLLHEDQDQAQNVEQPPVEQLGNLVFRGVPLH